MNKGNMLKNFNQNQAWKNMTTTELLVEFDKLNNWRPDWRDISLYQDYRFADKVRNTEYNRLLKDEDLHFAWEFLRRNKEYQEDFCELWIKNPEDIIFEANDLITNKYALQGDYLFAPWLNSPVETVYHIDEESLEVIFSYSLKVRFLSNERKITKRYSESDVALYFDVQGSIAEQLNRAEEYLKYVQNYSNKKQKQTGDHKIRRDKYKIYLMLLDAIDSGVSNSQIGKILYPYFLNNPDGMSKWVSDNKKQAEIMRSYGYSYLGSSATQRYEVKSVCVHGQGTNSEK